MLKIIKNLWKINMFALGLHLGTKMAEDGFKMAQDGLKLAQDGLKMASTWPKMAPR